MSLHNISQLALRMSMLLIILYGCSDLRQDYSIDPEVHRKQIDEWHSGRIESLQGPEGWLRLSGFHQLDQGRNTFGSDRGNDIVFPAGAIAGQAGWFERNGDTVSVHLNEGVDVTHEDAPMSSAVIFTPGGGSLMLENERLAFTIIQRQELIAVRIFDVESPYLTKFTGIDRFPVDTEWRIAADFIPHDEPVEVPITNILGQTYPVASPGKLLFEKDGEQWELLALEGNESMFINFGDGTNGNETYPAGRFLYTDEPDRNNRVVIDFNKAYNAPCVLTPYSTCPLPPAGNRLALRVTAGELMYKMPVE